MSIYNKEYDAIMHIYQYYLDNNIDKLSWKDFQKVFQRFSQKYNNLITTVRKNKPTVELQDISEWLMNYIPESEKYDTDYSTYHDKKYSTRDVEQVVLQINRKADISNIIPSDSNIDKFLRYIAMGGEMSGHPVSRNTVGWVRIDVIDNDNMLIDEIQTDIFNGLNQAKTMVSSEMTYDKWLSQLDEMSEPQLEDVIQRLDSEMVIEMAGDFGAGILEDKIRDKFKEKLRKRLQKKGYDFSLEDIDNVIEENIRDVSIKKKIKDKLIEKRDKIDKKLEKFKKKRRFLFFRINRLEQLKKEIEKRGGEMTFNSMKNNLLNEGWTEENLEKAKKELRELFKDWSEYALSSAIEYAREHKIKNVILLSSETLANRDPGVDPAKMVIYYDNLAKSFGFQKQYLNLEGVSGDFWVRRASKVKDIRSKWVRYINAGKIEYLKDKFEQRYPEKSKNFDEIIELDPSEQKDYVQWLLIQYIESNFDENIFKDIRTLLELYDGNQYRIEYPYNNIANFKNVEEFRDFVTDMGSDAYTAITNDDKTEENPQETGNQAFVSVNIRGSNVSRPKKSYLQTVNEEDLEKNAWIRQSDDIDNNKRIVMVQFSTNYLYRDYKHDEMDEYYKKLYSGTREGFVHPPDFWEIPTWISNVAYMVPNSDVYVVRNIDEAENFVRKSNYKLILFSALDINASDIIKLASVTPHYIGIGGYVNKELFKDLDNVIFFDSMGEFAKDINIEYKKGYDFRHFRDVPVIPRLALSEGCLHNCDFCVVPKGITESPEESIKLQVESFKELDATLIYLDDKTFGQAKNYTSLTDIYKTMKNANNDFLGFIVQTTALQMKKITPEFLHNSGIKYVELGVESYNDSILKKHRKPATEKLIDEAVEKLRQARVNFIPNIIIGLPEETAETYNHTLEFLKKNSDIISHINAYNLAIYENSDISKELEVKFEEDRNENIQEKSFHTDKEVHKKFYNEIYTLGMELLDKQPYDTKNIQSKLLKYITAKDIETLREDFKRKYIKKEKSNLYNYYLRYYAETEPKLSISERKEKSKEAVSVLSENGAEASGMEAYTVFNNLLTIDPTTSKSYLQWLMNLYFEDQLKEEDYIKASRYLKHYEYLVRNNKIRGIDVYTFKTLSDFWNAISPFVKEEDSEYTNMELDIINTQARKIFENENWIIYVPESYDASYVLSSDHWCTGKGNSDEMSRRYYREYSSQGDLIILINKNNRKDRYQFHFESNQFKNWDDYEINLDDFFEDKTDILDFLKEEYGEIACSMLPFSEKEIEFVKGNFSKYILGLLENVNGIKKAIKVAEMSIFKDNMVKFIYEECPDGKLPYMFLYRIADYYSDEVLTRLSDDNIEVRNGCLYYIDNIGNIDTYVNSHLSVSQSLQASISDWVDDSHNMFEIERAIDAMDEDTFDLLYITIKKICKKKNIKCDIEKEENDMANFLNSYGSEMGLYKNIEDIYCEEEGEANEKAFVESLENYLGKKFNSDIEIKGHVIEVYLDDVIDNLYDNFYSGEDYYENIIDYYESWTENVGDDYNYSEMDKFYEFPHEDYNYRIKEMLKSK